MGEARRRELSARQVAFAKGRYCIFCGGATIAETVEHYPPKGIFSASKWPEDYVFPACKACNLGTCEEDRWIAFMSRLEPGAPSDQKDVEKTNSLFRALLQRHPDEIRSMFETSPIRARQMARRLGMKPGPGETYRDLPIVHLPERVHEAVAVFALKLTKALHFQHTQQIVPADAGYKFRWWTNANYMEGVIPDEVFTIPSGTPVLKRTNVDLSDQFSYRYTVSEDGQLGMYTVMLRFAFCFTSLLSFDSKIIDDAIESASAR